MGHGKVFRRSMSLEEWAWLELARIEPFIIEKEIQTTGWQVREGQYYPEKYEWENDLHPIEKGDFWGAPDGAAEFVNTLTIPPEFAGKKVWLSMVTGAEVIVSKNGKLHDGIDPNRPRIVIANPAKANESIQIRMEAYTRSKPDDMRNPATIGIRGCVQRFSPPRLLVINEELLSLKYDMEMMLTCAYSWAPAEDIRAYLVGQIREMVKLFPHVEASKEELLATIPVLREFIDSKVYNADLPFRASGRLAMVAHSHLDIGYLWKVSQTVQKNARTCLIQLRMMERYPEFKYAHSQAWTYEALEKYYPELFEEVKKRVAEGRWEIVGAQYVEPDGNIPSAESMVRQLVYGKRYFLEKFGVDVDNCWLPDNFGNSSIMPQILRLAGVNYFLSNKMSTWNDVNKIQHNMFIWKGLDGTEINASIPPMHFISWNAPEQLFQSWKNFIDKPICSESLHMYGYGDGGSGVNEEMFENFKREKKFPGFPSLRLTTGKEYLDSAFKEAEGRLTKWDGELYLEMHRGTPTTKGHLKRANRQAEFLALQSEFLCTLAALQGATYPLAALTDAWKKILLNQFHDIIPGSHTEPVFFEAMETYKKLEDTLTSCTKDALDSIAPDCKNDACVTVVNPFSFSRNGVAFIDNVDAKFSCVKDNTGKELPIQKIENADGSNQVAIATEEINPLSIKSLALSNASSKWSNSPEQKAASNELENKYYRLKWNNKNQLISIYDKKRKREILDDGSIGNSWELFQDKPGQFNAWDLIDRYTDHLIEMPDWSSGVVIENGPISTALKFTRNFGKSKAQQIVRLWNTSPRIDFDTWIDWQETERVLKVAFPVSVKSRHFTTDTTAGILERDNHQNTSWQVAQFEVCCHKWVDLSEGLFGVALLNDCKYGCNVQDNILKLTLLRSPMSPDPVSDKGPNRFTYSIMSHGSDWRADNLVETAYDLNWPIKGVVSRKVSEALENKTILECSDAALQCQAVKMSEDKDNSVIVRFVELYGSRGSATIKPSFTFTEAYVTDLLERNVEKLTHSNNELILAYRPYEIKTVKFVR